jgi:hypothetical protein
MSTAYLRLCEKMRVSLKALTQAMQTLPFSKELVCTHLRNYPDSARGISKWTMYEATRLRLLYLCLSICFPIQSNIHVDWRGDGRRHEVIHVLPNATWESLCQGSWIIHNEILRQSQFFEETSTCLYNDEPLLALNGVILSNLIIIRHLYYGIPP